MNFLAKKPLTRLLSSSSSSRLLLRISLYSTSSASSLSSIALYSSSSLSRRHEEESRNVRVSVWWDFENCSIPCGVNVFKVAHSISAAVRACGIKGPIQITAFGDVFHMSRAHQEALSSTGVNLIHIPQGGKNSADRSLLLDLMCWVSQNPPPAHLFLISGDRDFAGILHRLRMSNYNILLASREGTPSVLCSAASVMWHWTELVKGENLTGRHFNQPPDGPYNSWYGHYRGTLEDPFAVRKKPRSLRADNSSDDEVSTDAKIRSVPNSVKKGIHKIVSSYPQGISSTELRESLKEIVNLGKDYFGFKKFSQLLLSMPDTVKVKYMNDGVYMLHAVPSKAHESVVSDPGTSRGLMINGENQESFITSGADCEADSTKKLANSKPPLPAPDADKNKEDVGKVLEREPKIFHVSDAHDSTVRQSNGEIGLDADVTDARSDIAQEKDSAAQMGFFQGIWSKWFRRSDGDSEKKNHATPEQAHSTSDRTGSSDSDGRTTKIHAISDKTHASSDSIGNSDSEGRNHESFARNSVSVPNISLSFQLERGVDANGDKNSPEAFDKSNDHPGFFSKVVGWCKNAFGGQRSEELGSITSLTEFELFLKDSFWAEMEAFIKTHKGLNIILSSRTRDQIVENFRKDGPVLLRSLKQADLLHLVDMLVSEKKWIEECPSENPSFRVLLSTSPTSAHPHNLNGLSSIFTRKPSCADREQLREENGDKKYPNLPHLGVSVSSTICRKSSTEFRRDVMVDCQNLLDSLLKEHPEGLNIGRFKQAFLQRYGYALDYQKLGFSKLVLLVETMSGVKVESNYIIPANTLVTKHESTEVGQREDSKTESPWEELGPVATSDLRNYEVVTGSGSSEMEDKDDGYESAASDDDGLSDPEEETGAAKPRAENEVDSSLLRVLDSWYSSKEEADKKDLSDDDHSMADYPKGTKKQPSRSSSLVSVVVDNSAAGDARKQRRGKEITFVSNADCENDKDKLIDGILGSLNSVKKSGRSPVQG